MISLRNSNRAAFVVFAWGALGLSLVIPASSWSQVAGATLSGTVTDASGAVVPQAQISIKNVATGISTVAPANTDGFYSAPNLLPGDYELTVTAPGFETEVRSGINLTVGAQQVLNLTLRVGQATQKVEVTGAAPAVELASSSISAVVGSNTVVELPLNGRDWTQLAALQPGVNVVLTQDPIGVNASRGNRGFGNQMTISGTRPQMNNYRLDGISIVDYVGGAPGSALGLALGVDAVAEFSVITADYSAEYGRTSGGVINAVTKSGTNQIHGDAYEFLRNSALDARDFFDSSLPPFRRNQFGGSAGGPIQKDKTFFFADYEGLRQAQGVTSVDKVPSPNARNGIINVNGTNCTIGVASPGCTLTNSAGTVGVDPLVKPFLGLWPLPNAGLNKGGNTGLYDIANNNVGHDNFVTTRIDRKFSEKDSIFGTWFLDKGLNDAPDALNSQILGNTSNRLLVDLEETHVFSPSLVNSVRGGYSRVDQFANHTLQIVNPLSGDLSLGSFPGLWAPAITVTGLTGFVGGKNGLKSSDQIWNSFQGYDDAFLTKGVHSLKFGFAFERMQFNRRYALSNNNGAFTFGSLTGFLTNAPTVFSGSVSSTGATLQLRQSLLGGYIQDDWRVRPNFTLNLGLRYEMVTGPTDTHNWISNLRNITDTMPFLGAPLFTTNPSLHNFEPRVGFSWDPSHNGKTAIRGAFGVFDALPLPYETYPALVNAAPYFETFSEAKLAPGAFPTEAANGAIVLNQSKLRHLSLEPNPPRNYVMIWNLNVQHQLTPSTSLMLGYVGNHGVHMLNRVDDIDDVLPTQSPAGLLWPSPIGSGTIFNTNTKALVGDFWSGDALYDALEAQVTKRMGHGFQVQGSYTWGKNIDTGSAAAEGDPYTNSISSLFWFCKTCRRGISDYGIAQTLIVNYIWDLPTPKNWGALGSHVLGGWELGGIITAETGVPFTPLIGGDPLGLNNTDPYAFPNRLTGPGCANPVNPGNISYVNLSCFAVPMATAAIAAQCSPFQAVPGSCSNLMGNAGRNTVIGPGLASFDFSLFKNNYIRKISENFNVQFRAEFFNVLNRANFQVPTDNETFFDVNGNPVANAGALDSISVSAREIQFALKVIF